MLLTLVGIAAQADPTHHPGTADRRQVRQPAVRRSGCRRLRRAVQQPGQPTTPPARPTCWSPTTPSTRSPANGAGNITTKPGCSVVPAQRRQRRHHGDHAEPEEQRARRRRHELLHRLGALEPGQGHGRRRANLTFYAQSRDAVGYATIGNAYAPTTPLTTAQLKDIFECTDHRLEPGRWPGRSDRPLPAADTAATYTFFLKAIGSSLTTVHADCDGSRPTPAAERRLAPSTVTRWGSRRTP